MKKVLYIFVFSLLAVSCKEYPNYGESADPMVRIVEDSISMTIGESRKLTLSCSITGVEWESSADSVATVNYQGRVTANSAGMTYVTAHRNENHSVCVVTVRENVLP